MNWATPRAPAGLTASGRNELSRQMSLVKKPTGSPSVLAELSRIPHSVTIALSVSGPASATAVRQLSPRISAASAMATSLTNLARWRRPSKSAYSPHLAPSLQFGGSVRELGADFEDPVPGPSASPESIENERSGKGA